MQQFHHHPDGLIFLRTDQGVYSGTPEQFAEDFGEAAPALPPNCDERIYEPGARHALKNRQGMVAGGPRKWDFGDRAIAAISILLQKKADREAAEQAAREAALQAEREAFEAQVRAKREAVERAAQEARQAQLDAAAAIEGQPSPSE